MHYLEMNRKSFSWCKQKLTCHIFFFFSFAHSRASFIHLSPTRPQVSAYIRGRVMHQHHLAITSLASVTSYNNHRVLQRQLARPPNAPTPIPPTSPLSSHCAGCWTTSPPVHSRLSPHSRPGCPADGHVEL